MTTDRETIRATLARLCEMVARRLREHGLHARTVQLKLRYKDFTTITRAATLEHATMVDTEIIDAIRRLFDKNWNGKPVRLLGVHTASFETGEGQLHLLDDGAAERWKKALGAVDALRDRFGEESVSLASGMGGRFRERTHENPVGLPGKRKR